MTKLHSTNSSQLATLIEKYLRIAGDTLHKAETHK